MADMLLMAEPPAIAGQVAAAGEEPRVVLAAPMEGPNAFQQSESTSMGPPAAIQRPARTAAGAGQGSAAASQSLITGAPLEQFLKESGVPLKIMVMVNEAPVSLSNPYYRAEVIAIDRNTKRMQLRYQYYGDRMPFWLPVSSARLWRGSYPLCEWAWANLGKVRWQAAQ